jgi:hypothetical protein
MEITMEMFGDLEIAIYFQFDESMMTMEDFVYRFFEMRVRELEAKENLRFEQNHG